VGQLEFLLAVAGLLVTPGPTNTLLAVAGASVGLRRALPLIPAGIAGYLVVAVPLAIAGQAVILRSPTVGHAVKIAAALWVMVLAVRLWRPEAAVAGRALVTWRSVFVTTLLNPKGLIFGLVLLPSPDAGTLAARVLMFGGLIVLVALLWAWFGALLHGRGAHDTPPLALRRAASVWLGIVAVGLAASVARS
jgi:threonine/homoserine/homoserine lactone efflux protein